MLKEKDIASIGQARFPDGNGVTLESIKYKLMVATGNFAIPVAFGHNQIQFGNLFSKTAVDCLTMYHPNQKGYSYYAFTVSRQGSYAFVEVYSAGESAIGLAQFAKENIFNMNGLSAYNKGMVVGSLIGSVVNGSIFKNSSERDAEKRWYAMVNDVLEDVLGIGNS